MLSNVGDIDSMVQNAAFILAEENFATFKANALARANEFAIDKIRPHYESLYVKVLENTAR